MKETDIWIFYSFIDKGISMSSDDLVKIPLSAFDLYRIRKMQRKEDRDRSIIGRLLLLNAIKNFNISKDAMCSIEWDKFKKPFIKAISPLQFNISHSEQYVVCALTSCKVGVDIEKIDYEVDINDFEDVFSKIEHDSIHISSTPYWQFYKLWTLKESILKAKGTGFFTSPSDVVTLESPAKIDDEYFFTYHAFIDDYSLSVATSLPIQNIHLIKMSLL